MAITRQNVQARAQQIGLKLSWHKPGGVGKTVYAVGVHGDFHADDRTFCGTLRDCDAYVSGYGQCFYEQMAKARKESL